MELTVYSFFQIYTLCDFSFLMYNGSMGEIDKRSIMHNADSFLKTVWCTAVYSVHSVEFNSGS